MNHMKNRISVLATAMAVVVASAFAQAALADDKIIMNDGRVFEGEIVREVDGYIWIKVGSGGLARPELLAMGDIKEIVRDTPAATAQATPAKGSAASIATIADKATQAETKPVVSTTGQATRAAIITLGEGGGKDMVGLFMTAHILKEIKPLLKKDDVEIVVFLINSGGGALLEIQRLSDVIEEEYKGPDGFRTVAWIESAISAAAMTAHSIEVIYFMPEGNYGACTGYSGALNAMKGRSLEEVVYMMEKISARGGYDPDIMKAMQHSRYALSADITEDGDVLWWGNEEGESVVNPLGRILTFDSESALRFGFSRGTARTLEELEDAMQLGEVEWVGRDVKGFFYPISKAEDINMRFRKKTFDDQTRANEYFLIYQAAIQLASNEQERQRRAMFVGKARTQLNAIVSMVRNNPNLALFVMNMLEDQYTQWVAEQRQLLKDLMR